MKAAGPAGVHMPCPQRLMSQRLQGIHPSQHMYGSTACKIVAITEDLMAAHFAATCTVSGNTESRHGVHLHLLWSDYLC